MATLLAGPQAALGPGSHNHDRHAGTRVAFGRSGPSVGPQAGSVACRLAARRRRALEVGPCLQAWRLPCCCRAAARWGIGSRSWCLARTSPRRAGQIAVNPASRCISSMVDVTDFRLSRNGGGAVPEACHSLPECLGAMERRGRLLADLGYPVTPRLARMFVVVGRRDRFSTVEKQWRESSRWMSRRGCVRVCICARSHVYAGYHSV